MFRILPPRRHRTYPGLYRALVVNDSDPQQSHRVQVRMPSLTDSASLWATTLRDLGGRPQVGDEVLIGFEAGQPNNPYIVGVLATGSGPVVRLSDDHGNSMSLASSGIEITTEGSVRINASTIQLSAATASADADVWTFSGAVQSQTVIADSVIANSYSPGAGNLM